MVGPMRLPVSWRERDPFVLTEVFRSSLRPACVVGIRVEALWMVYPTPETTWSCGALFIRREGERGGMGPAYTLLLGQ